MVSWLDSVLFDVGDDADDLAPDIGTVRDQDAFADRVLVREKLPGQRFVNDCDARCAGVVMLIEKATTNQPNAHGAKIIGRNRIIIGVW